MHFAIDGIGESDTGIAFLHSDLHDEYYARVGLLHGCVIIMPSDLARGFAFVSPRNGKVYNNWMQCKRGE